MPIVATVKVAIVITLHRCQFVLWHFPVPWLGRFAAAGDLGPSAAITVNFTESNRPNFSPRPAGLD